jgi:hypothetical protein
MIIPITVHGTDNSGQVFRENTWTIGVNKQGAKIATFHPLRLGGQISVVNPVLGRTAKARVIWVGEKRFPEDPYEVGVELMEAQNVWGIKFPPEDWQKPTSTGIPPRVHDGGTTPVTATTQQATKPARPEAPKPSEAVKAAETSAATSKDSGASPEKFNQFNLALAALSSHFQAETPAESAPAAGPQQAANLLEALQEKEKNLRGLEEQIKAQADRLEASRDQVGLLLAKLSEVQQGWQAEIQKARRALQEAATEALESTLESSGRQVIDRLTESLSERTRRNCKNSRPRRLRALARSFNKNPSARSRRPAGSSRNAWIGRSIR